VPYFRRFFAIVSRDGYSITIKAKLICGKYLTIFTKTDTGYTAACPDFPNLRITGSTLKETERIVNESISTYIRRTDSLTTDRTAFLRVNKLWKDVVEPAVGEVERKASKNGWVISTFVNKRGFNQINRFNRSCSIRTVREDKTTRKLTIGWRAGSTAFSYGNTLTAAGWKEIPHSMISYDILVEDLTDRLLV
jgi:predicted RNase H-like HicB family nuclease